MAIACVGFDGTVSEAQFARLMRHHGEVGYKHGVSSGFTISNGAGTRESSITAGTAVLPGLLVESDATVSKTHAANATGVNRADIVVLRADWSTNTASVEVVQGSSSALPALTQTEGTLWEMPIGVVTVRPSVTTFLSTDLRAAKPLPRNTITYVGTVNGAVNVAYNGTWTTAGTITVTDPGWPYSLALTESVRFFPMATGYAKARIVDNFGTELLIDYSPRLDVAGVVGLHSSTVVPSLFGPRTLSLQVAPEAMSTGSSIDMPAGPHYFTAQVIPA